MIYVTHDQVEAMTMGDRICVMRDGLIMQVADPLTLYRQPDNLFVAGFIGGPPMTSLKGRSNDGTALCSLRNRSRKTLCHSRSKESSKPWLTNMSIKVSFFWIRPEHITNEPKEGSSVPITLTIDSQNRWVRSRWFI